MSTGRVLLAAPRSFCAGVDRAIEIVERLLEQHGAPVYVRHQIVHNEHVVRRLEALGAVFVEDESEIPAGRVLRPLGPRRRAVGQGERAGARPQDRRRDVPAREQGACRGAPVRRQRPSRCARRACKSRRGDRDARRAAERHGRDRVAGRGAQPEDRQARRRDHADDAVARRRGADRRRARRERRRRPCAGRTTTTSVTRRRTGRTPSRRWSTQDATLILVIGSENSSNAQRLVEVGAVGRRRLRCSSTARARSTTTLLVGHEVVGLTAGASTPEELVRATAERLALRGYPTLEEITVAREDVHFRLPREVARA